jgi:hypothetical protein
VEAARRKYASEGMKVNCFTQDIDKEAVIKVANESKEKL